MIGRWFSGIMLVPLVACTASSSPPLAPVALTVDYQRGIRAAAVRDPSFAVDLQTIGPEQDRVVVANFTEKGVPAAPTQGPIWVSLPDQLRALCRDKPDAVLAVQEALGLPPQPVPSRTDHQWQVITFSVPRSALFRPCPGGTDIAAPRCANTLSTTLDSETTRFLLGQLWSSHRADFRKADGSADWGYPFTGMGWSYNWDPHATSPVGVSEFVIRTGSMITSPTATTPAQFCGAATGPA